MREFRKAKGVTERYTSLEELRTAYGRRPVIKQTKDKEKLAKQRENFCGFYKCKACGEPMAWFGESIMACTNERCKGIKQEIKDKEGNIISVEYLVSYELLEDEYAERAKNIFYETN